jgi:hypothetical protein
MRRTILLAAAIAALGATQAHAHARLIHATPRVGSTVSASPHELRLLFSESIDPAQSSVNLSTRDERAVALGPLSLDAKDHRVVVVAVPTTLASGTYHVEWRMTSMDTHRTEGDFTFNVKP